MDGRQSLVASTKISPELSQRLKEELARNPNAEKGMRDIAARALQNGRTADAWLAGKEAAALKQMVI